MRVLKNGKTVPACADEERALYRVVLQSRTALAHYTGEGVDLPPLIAIYVASKAKGISFTTAFGMFGEGNLTVHSASRVVDVLCELATRDYLSKDELEWIKAAIMNSCACRFGSFSRLTNRRHNQNEMTIVWSTEILVEIALGKIRYVGKQTERMQADWQKAAAARLCQIWEAGRLQERVTAGQIQSLRRHGVFA